MYHSCHAEYLLVAFFICLKKNELEWSVKEDVLVGTAVK